MTTRRGDDGFVLVAVLWMLAALAALASAYAVFAVETAPSAALPEQRLQAEAALRAGVELCAYRQLSWPRASRPDAGAFSTQVGIARVDVVYRSETGRVDINSAPPELLAALFQQLGVAADAAGQLADRIVAWRAKLKDSARRLEGAIYAKAKLPYGPVGAPFDNALEIALLPGMSPDLAARALRYVTIYGGSKIDPLVADPLVLAALPGATADIVNGFLKARNGPPLDPQGLQQLAGATRNFVITGSSDYVRAEIVATLNGRKLRAEVVLKLVDGGATPFEIMYWRDDFDGDATGG